MELKHHPGVISRSDSFVVDPRVLKVDPGYNVRDLKTPENREHIDGLKESIAANSVRTPLEVRLQGEDIFVVSGHCRLIAVMELIAEGHDEIKGVPCVRESKNTNDAERTLNLAISNSGKPLTTLEVAEVVRRLEGFGWTPEEIQKRMRWKSKATVTQHEEIAALPEGTKQLIKSGEISPTLARNIAKGVDPEVAEKLIRDNLEENKRIKGARAKVTAKTIKRDQKAKEAPRPNATAEAMRDAPPPPIRLPVLLAPVASDMPKSIALARDGRDESLALLTEFVTETRKLMRAIQIENPNCNFGGLPECIGKAQDLLAKHGDVKAPNEAA